MCLVTEETIHTLLRGGDTTEKQWIGPDMPSIEAHSDDVFGLDVPDYALRCLILPIHPLASSLAFSVQIRLVLAIPISLA